MPFAIRMVRRELKDHFHGCYFCDVDTNGFSSKNKHLLMYPCLDSACSSVAHNATLPIQVPPENALTSVHDRSDNSEVESYGEDECELDANFMCQDDNYAPQLLSQEDLNGFVRDLAFSKANAELLASRLQQNNVLENNVCVTYFQKHCRDLASFFTVQDPLCYCHGTHSVQKISV